jgi:spore coat protein U-like protein
VSGRGLCVIGRLLLWLVWLGLTASPAFALTCRLGVISVVFTSLDVTTGAPDDASGTATMDCVGIPANRRLRFCVSIDGGTASDATSRFMTSGTSLLRFQLYTDAARTVPWGSWAPNLYGGGFQWDVLTTRQVGTFTVPVFGRILPNQQTVPQGTYLSGLTATATYESNAIINCPFSGAGTTSNSFSAAARVQTTCTVSASNLSFGTLGHLTGNVDAISDITAQCANGAPYTVGLSAGNGPGATVAVRQMTRGAKTLNYSLYQDSSRTRVWGETIGTDTVTGIGNGTAQSYTVYGRIPPQTIPGPGLYTDTIVVTVTF